MRLFAATATILLMSTTAIAQTPASAPAGANVASLPASNPFAAASTLPLGAPPFDRIKSSDYAPALLAGMAQQRAEVRAIANARSAPTFDNTIAALERSGRLLERASLAFEGVVGANTDDVLQKTEADLAPAFAAHQDAINLDPALFARVRTLYDKRRTLGLTPEQLQVLTLTYQNMVRAGALLSPADKVTLSQYNAQLSTLETAFQQKLLAATKAGALVVEDRAKLAGLSEAEIAAAADAAKARGLAGKYVLTLQNTTQQPELASLTDRATREALFRASWTRAEKGDANDTRDTIAQIALLRAQKAKLLGFPTWADYVLQDQMAKNPQTALAFMQRLGKPVAVEQHREAAELQARIKATGGDFKLKPWDWDFYSEQVRKAKYDLN